MKQPVTINRGGRAWLVWDVRLFRVAFDLASAGAKAIAQASGLSGYSSVSGFSDLDSSERVIVVNDARRILALMSAKKGAA